MTDTLSAIAAKDWNASLIGASLSDWITVAAYLAAALIAILAARTAGKRFQTREKLFWLFTAALLVLFAINELFDFQTIVTALGKAWALRDGWYENRRLHQLEFVIALSLAAVVAGIALMWLTRGTHRAVRWALLGLVFIGLFVLLRAASFHHVGNLLEMGPDAFNLGSMQEMAGILLVGIAACAYAAWPPDVSGEPN